MRLLNQFTNNMVVQMNSPFVIKGIEASSIKEAFIRKIGDKAEMPAKSIKVNKNGTFETCSNRTCNYRKQIAELVPEAEENNSL